MIKLDRLSKYYSQNGIVSAGLSKVNLEFDIGEFVAITGESGSGKSTLLNVISGIDTYEEGEMYIDGNPTSGFSVDDLEKYRKKYIANIFQAFNLINSYTVYQNVELILLAAGYRKDEVTDKVKEIIDKVGLTEYINTKASKLSGGQKQRVAIARALAKDTPVIVADEPTGNLDSVSAGEIIRLLNELAQDKLIVIVTHNYEQVEGFVTRKITMSDGSVVEDKKLGESRKTEGGNVSTAHEGTLTAGNRLRLGIRNTFNIPSKFLLLLVVFMFLCAGTIMQYSSSLNSQDESVTGWNSYFDTRGDRIIVTHEDKSEFKQSDYDAISDMDNVKEIIKDDITIDMSLSLESKDEYLSLQSGRYSEYEGRLTEGRMPEDSDEACIFFPEDSYAAEVISEADEKDKYILGNDRTGDELVKNLKITGYGYLTSEEEQELYSGDYTEGVIVLNSKGMSALRSEILKGYCSQEYEFAGNILSSTSYELVPNSKVPEGSVYIPEDIGYLYNGYAAGQTFKLTNSSIYFEDKYKLSVGAVYTEYTFNYYTGLKYDDTSGTEIYMNDEEYSELFEKGSYQISVIADDEKLAESVENELKAAGYVTFRTSEGMVSFSEAYDKIEKLMSVGVLAIVLLVLFFISYFIIRLIMKSRNTYFSTIRMLGATKRDCRNLIEIELFAVMTIAFSICTGAVLMIKAEIISAGEYLTQLAAYLNGTDFVILYVILAVISILLGRRYSRQLFKKSAMNTFKEEV